MNISRCDVGESLRAYETNPKSMFKEGSCYCNAFKLLVQYVSLQKPVSGVIGYVLSTDGERKVAVRHSWVRDERTGQAIDVSAVVAGYHPVSMVKFKYVEVMVMSPMEWMKETENNDEIPCLPETRKEKTFLASLRKQGYEILDDNIVPKE